MYQCEKCGRISVVKPTHCKCEYKTKLNASTTPHKRSPGPGSELKAIIPEFLKKEGCGCDEYARQMDQWGVEECEKRYDEITDHLVKKAKERFPLLPEMADRVMIRRWLGEALDRAKVKIDLDWFVAITTAPREKPTLVQCVNSLKDAGWDPIVFGEPGSQNSGVEQHIHKKRLGCWFNWVHSCKEALKSKASLIMTVQDDAFFHPGSKQFAEKVLWPDSKAAFLSLYCPAHYSKDTPPGVKWVDTLALWGAVALVWDRKILEKVIENPIALKWIGAPAARQEGENYTQFAKRKNALYAKRQETPHMVQNSDYAIGKICNAMHRKMYFVDPSPVTHIAEHSSIGHSDNTGNRNCLRCAEIEKPLEEQIPHKPAGVPIVT